MGRRHITPLISATCTICSNITDRHNHYRNRLLLLLLLVIIINNNNMNNNDDDESHHCYATQTSRGPVADVSLPLFQWKLVCENEALTDASQTLLLAGMMVGAVLFTSLADKFGRKPFHIGCHLGLLAVGMASAFVPTFAAFLPLRFFLGAFQQVRWFLFECACVFVT